MSIDKRINDKESRGFFEKFSTSKFFKAVGAASLGTFLYFSTALGDINLTVKTENKQKARPETKAVIVTESIVFGEEGEWVTETVGLVVSFLIIF